MAHLQGHQARPGLRVNGEVSGLLGTKETGQGPRNEKQKNKTKHSLPLYCKYNLDRQRIEKLLTVSGVLFSVQIYIRKKQS